MSGERYADMAVVLVVTLSLQILPVIISPVLLNCHNNFV